MLWCLPSRAPSGAAGAAVSVPGWLSRNPVQSTAGPTGSLGPKLCAGFYLLAPCHLFHLCHFSCLVKLENNWVLFHMWQCMCHVASGTPKHCWAGDLPHLLRGTHTSSGLAFESLFCSDNLTSLVRKAVSQSVSQSPNTFPPYCHTEALGT